MTIDEIIDLYESFYLLEPIEEKWGRWGTWKCMCENFMSGALCSHSLLMALLYDMTLKFPAKHSTKKLEHRGKQTRRPNAWAPEDEEEEDAAQGTKLHWCPITPCDDMDLIPATKSKAAAKPCMGHTPQAASDDSEDGSSEEDEPVDSCAVHVEDSTTAGADPVSESCKGVAPDQTDKPSVRMATKFPKSTKSLSQPVPRSKPGQLQLPSTSSSQPEGTYTRASSSRAQRQLRSSALAKVPNKK
eukprot:CAMPEP_0172154284 /NCGR_PEP_ID=MMETSP1050-20130122/1944_1 /TAXON_ID=233186 /ORGANISM="Cryptomonas curvata, Strain CCAP979/52" /LENGTH=243 /DNA_ID=CAMNT_0012822973 /DNA_START=34 /DNA_END=765 /DNA_ORIENTATION=+